VLDMTGLKGRYDITVNLADYMADMQPGAGTLVSCKMSLSRAPDSHTR